MADGPSADIAVRLRNVVKHYQSLRPLRLRDLEIHTTSSLALLGFDAAMAEVFVTLLTAGGLPDEGEVIVFGEPTTSVSDHRSWMTLLDRFGLVSDRGVLLEQLTVEQNLAMPLTLTVLHSMTDAVRADVRRLADEVGLPSAHLARSLADVPASSVIRLRLGRALALRPQVLLAEHPNATLAPDEASALASDIARIRRDRAIASVVMTADRRFAEAVADELLTLQPATGELKAHPKRRRWFPWNGT
jgi:ABC-type transporter Mla maintaining outer membrane lipid asymmetry ATPase subunit MlaF